MEFWCDWLFLLVSDWLFLLSQAGCFKRTLTLQKEITRDRESHGKKPLKEKDRNDPPSSSGNSDMTKEEEIPEGVKTQKCSTTDPESGWFRKGEHKHVFAYAVETACDKHGWILGYSIHPGNEHDSRTFKTLYDKIKMYSPDMIIADAGYRTPAIARELLEDGIKPLFPYKRPMTKEGYFRKYEYVYDEYYDCYICPENHILSYHTTNRGRLQRVQELRKNMCQLSKSSQMYGK